MVSFRDKPVEERIKAVHAIRTKYPDRIPICVYKDPNSKAPLLDKEKFLVPMDMSVGQFVYVIRKRIKLQSNEAIYIFFNGTIIDTNSLLSSVYEKHKDSEDKMLYCIYAIENTFG